MKSSDRHPTRAQMLAAARSGPGRLRGHLQRCAECLKWFEMLRRFSPAGSAGLMAPSEDAVERWINVSLLAPPPSLRTKSSGRVVCDSWRERPAAVRDRPEGLVRRLRLAAPDLDLEIVGEQRRREWRFIARVYRGRTAAGDFVLRAGRQRVVPGGDGFLTWSSSRPPRTVVLISPDREIRFENVSW